MNTALREASGACGGTLAEPGAKVQGRVRRAFNPWSCWLGIALIAPSACSSSDDDSGAGAGGAGFGAIGGANGGASPATAGTAGANGGTLTGFPMSGGSASVSGSASGGTQNSGGSVGGGFGGRADQGQGGTPGGSAGEGNGGGAEGGASSGGDGGADTMVCPPGITQTITVAKDGSGQFMSVQEAIDSIANGSATHIRIDIAAGTYMEKLTIAGRTNLCLVGAGATDTVLSYRDSNALVGSTSGSASVLISADDFSAANLTFENTYGPGSQAVALRTTGQRQQFSHCRFVGYQDTLYAHQGTQYFRDCYVQGNVDYVFGGATAVLENCEVRNVEGGSATSAPNTDARTAYGIVFLGGRFTAASGVRANSVGLARPWGAAGFAAFINVDLGAHIISAGFVPMSGNQPGNARFHEFQSTGPGANAPARSAYQLTAEQAADYTLTNVFPRWTPSYSQ